MKPQVPNGDRTARASDEVTLAQFPAATSRDSEPTIDHTPQSGGSKGLHIRCPHCSNPVELLTDTSLESITCDTCGSMFSLVEDEEQTRAAPALKRIGRFELVSRVGMGGFGTVWKARDTELDRTVAVKIPRKGQLRRAEMEQFLREARSAAQLRHPNIVPVHEVGRDEDTIFIVSDLIRGVSLSDWLSGAKPTPREVAELMATVAGALHHAHQKGIIHRDLKPSNILLDEQGQPHLMDFGLAKREVGEITMTIEGHVLGTPAYMSPEQAEGAAHWTDRRSDIYSLGVVLFRMLTGELPFRGNAQMQIHQRLTEEPPDPRKLNRHLPRDLCTICLKCLERDPNRRFATAEELANELRRYLRHEPILSRPISRTERVLRWSRRNPALASAGALTVLLAFVGMVAIGWFIRKGELLLENNRLINRYQDDITDYKEQVADLQGQLDVLQGKANPFEFWLWPPKRDEPRRRNMVTRVLDQSGASLARALGDGKYDRDQSARGYLALAKLAHADGQSADARGYYERASRELSTLREMRPDEPQWARALADCHLRLAELAHSIDDTAAAKEREAARSIYRQLADTNAAPPRSQIEWLEVEMLSAMGTTGEPQAAHLTQVAKIDRDLSDKWPNDPDALYQLACFLTAEEPLLVPQGGMESGNTRPPGDNGTRSTGGISD